MYRHHRFPPDVIAHAVWLYLRIPLSLRMVEDLLAERGIIVSHQTIRVWAEKFGRQLAGNIRRRSAGQFDSTMASRRSCHHNSRQETLALARSRSGRLCPRCAGTKSPQYQSSQGG